MSELREAMRLADEHQRSAVAISVGAKEGVHLLFEVEPGFEENITSLEHRKAGIEIVATQRTAEAVRVTVYVPAGKLHIFERKLRAYADSFADTLSGNPANSRLISIISEIRLAVLADLWTDDAALPADGLSARFEVWTRAAATTTAFIERAKIIGLSVSEKFLVFPDRHVFLVTGTIAQLAASVDVLDEIAELRRAKDAPLFYAELRGPDAREWSIDLLGRVITVDDPASVCLLDSGVTHAHPLLSPFIDPEAVLAARPEWRIDDTEGHGTMMAGLALFGDLSEVFRGNGPVVVESVLESVKIYPGAGGVQRDLHGVITRDAVSLVEIVAPERRRVFALTVTAPVMGDRGRPTSWSAEIDRLACAVDGGPKRLFIVSAGNNWSREAWSSHPSHLSTEEIHDPAQAWNAITVGAFTEKWEIDEEFFDEWHAVARPGDLSPLTSTSCAWSTTWPLKPDVVFEGGNAATDAIGSQSDTIDSLALLTTHSRPEERLFRTTGETSAACALGARFGGTLETEYPHLRPETIRALLVHSASWTNVMRETYGGTSRTATERLIRHCGFGVPSIERARWSASNQVTLLAESTIQPFAQGRSGISLNEMHLHRLPWPSELLRDLGDSEVELRVTLSYFVEPNPARRGWARRHRYASHGLRFEMQMPEELLDGFRSRVNLIAREEDESQVLMTSADDPKWDLGPRLRTKGSLHSDRWRGPAAQLADREHIAVFPVGGWWKEKPHLKRGNDSVDYSLVVSISASELEVDLYTPIATMIATEVPIMT
ncbi:MAG: S8 family peptidase [Acidobacteria bacterium]|nr:S8 family peptidase [Acidobacteriota bacterium]MBV9188830.1 S8 family peptidase [Acidobacteriota bacterium]